MGQRKRPGRRAYLARRQGALDRLLEKYPDGTERPVGIQKQIDTLTRVLGMSAQEAK